MYIHFAYMNLAGISHFFDHCDSLLHFHQVTNIGSKATTRRRISTRLSCVAVCRSELQRVAVESIICCSVSQRFAMCCSRGYHVLQCVAVSCNVLQSVAMCCSQLQCVAVSCNVLQSRVSHVTPLCAGCGQ